MQLVEQIVVSIYGIIGIIMFITIIAFLNYDKHREKENNNYNELKDYIFENYYNNEDKELLNIIENNNLSDEYDNWIKRKNKEE